MRISHAGHESSRDAELFGPAAQPVLRRATSELSWLLTRGYSADNALQLVGDRHELRARQRAAVWRCSCGDETRRHRRGRRIPRSRLKNAELAIDGFNVLTTVKTALQRRLVLKARDGAHRDLTSIQTVARHVDATRAAIEAVAVELGRLRIRGCRWLLDRPVPFSGRMKELLASAGRVQGLRWTVEIVDDPDPLLIQSSELVASADGRVMDHAVGWFDLAGAVLSRQVPTAWIVDLSG